LYSPNKSTENQQGIEKAARHKRRQREIIKLYVGYSSICSDNSDNAKSFDIACFFGSNGLFCAVTSYKKQ